MRRVRFAPSPTGSLHVGNALSAVANRNFGDHLLLRIDDTDPARNLPGGEEQLMRDLEWLELGWDEGPVRQSERRDRHVEAAAELGERFDGVTLLRENGTPTYHLASVVDDVDFGITHIVRGNDHRPNEALHRRLFEALGAPVPEFVHHGLILGEDGKKLAKRAEGATVASLRDAGILAEAVRRYLEELDLPRHDVHYDLPRIHRLAIEAIGALRPTATMRWMNDRRGNPPLRTCSIRSRISRSCIAFSAFNYSKTNRIGAWHASRRAPAPAFGSTPACG